MARGGGELLVFRRKPTVAFPMHEWCRVTVGTERHILMRRARPMAIRNPNEKSVFQARAT